MVASAMVDVRKAFWVCFSFVDSTEAVSIIEIIMGS
jgi:hypothetical protein